MSRCGGRQVKTHFHVTDKFRCAWLKSYIILPNWDKKKQTNNLTVSYISFFRSHSLKYMMITFFEVVTNVTNFLTFLSHKAKKKGT